MSQAIEQALVQLRAGGLVAIPTETVYGLAADASNVSAVKKIFQEKNRPADHPLIVHIHDPCSSSQSQAQKDDAWAELLSTWSSDVPAQALILARHFWPGPLTMILPKAKGVLDEVTGGQETVGLRCPNHPIALELLKSFQGGLAAPSANRFGRISPTSAQHVRDELSDDVLIIDGGPSEVGIESTIVDLTRLATHGPVILRPGMISQEQIEASLGLKAGIGHATGGPQVSGSLSAHYAPRTKMIFVKDIQDSTHAQHVAWVHFLGSQLPKLFANTHVSALTLPETPQEVAKDLYALLRKVDGLGCDLICFDNLPSGSNWYAIADRLTRAVNGSGRTV
jgi:L-threonylcarbamoyladenylate synthase